MPSIRRRLLVTLLAAFAVIWASVVVITYANVRDQVEERFDDQLAQTAQVLWLLFARARAAGTSAPEDLYAGRIIARFGVHYAFQVWDGLELVARSANAPERRMASGYGASDGAIDGEPWRFYYRVDALRGLDVIVGNALADRQSVVGALVFGTVWPVLAGLPVLALLVILGVHRGLEPLRSIARSIAERDADSAKPIPTQHAPREVSPLVRALNELLGRLHARIERERHFTADASHELRTPLAALRAQAQVAQRAETDADRRQALDKLIAGVDRATHLVEQLLTLAGLDPDNPHENAARVDLKAVAEEAMAELDGAARRRNVNLALRGEPSVVRGRSAALSVLLRNLVDNAIRHSPAGSTVDVSIETIGDTVILSVRDQGPGIPAEDRERVFDRFYRRLGTQTDGSGLGLSIVARVAEVHRAHGSLEAAEPGPAGDQSPGLAVIVRFPTASTDAG